MKRFFVCFALLAAMFLMISCGGDSQKLVKGGNSEKKAGELNGECYGNGTCNKGLLCDEESNICVEDPENPVNDSENSSEQTNDDTDSIDDSSDSESDENDSDGTSADSVSDDDSDSTDTVPDNSDSTPDEEDTDADSGDSTPDTDTDSGDSTPDNDSDTTPADPCDPNPCNSIENSTGVCIVNKTVYTCGCNNGYFWNGSECKKQITLGNICTGHTRCYNNTEEITCPTSETADFYGQDAYYASLGKCTPQSIYSSSNVVIDNNTGLTWEKSPSSGTYTWDNRATHCNELNSSNYGGKSNWRVPNPQELLTIVDNSKSKPATNANFTYMPTSGTAFWTSKEFVGNSSYAYYFSPSDGGYSRGVKTETCKVLCVSGDEMQPATSADFTTQTISGKVVVTDSKTGLMWQKEYAKDRTWQQALKYCEGSTYAGYSDWRLPNKNELSSLINYEKSKTCSDFPDMPGMDFWSSSTRILGTTTSGAWEGEFVFGSLCSLQHPGSSYVRCVRSE